jgi:hypothetical protein
VDSDNATKIAIWLKARRNQPYCHKCVSENTGVKPTQQINQIIRPLGKAKDFRYYRTTCMGCSADAMCVVYVG